MTNALELSGHDRVLAFIRTYVPYSIGAILAWLLAVSRLDLTGPFQVGLVAFAVAVVTNVYYVLIRLLEYRFPMIGVLLGAPRQPEYTAVDNLWASLVRTAIPTLVAAVVITVIGAVVMLDAETSTTLIVVGTAIVQGLYYALAKAIIAKWPRASILLGTPETETSYVKLAA